MFQNTSKFSNYERKGANLKKTVAHFAFLRKDIQHTESTFNQIQTCLIICKVYKRPFNPFLNIFSLLEFENVLHKKITKYLSARNEPKFRDYLVELLLKHLVCIIYAQLFKAITIKNFKPK